MMRWPVTSGPHRRQAPRHRPRHAHRPVAGDRERPARAAGIDERADHRASRRTRPPARRSASRAGRGRRHDAGFAAPADVRSSPNALAGRERVADLDARLEAEAGAAVGAGLRRMMPAHERPQQPVEDAAEQARAEPHRQRQPGAGDLDRPAQAGRVLVDLRDDLVAVERMTSPSSACGPTASASCTWKVPRPARAVTGPLIQRIRASLIGCQPARRCHSAIWTDAPRSPARWRAGPPPSRRRPRPGRAHREARAPPPVELPLGARAARRRGGASPRRRSSARDARGVRDAPARAASSRAACRRPLPHHARRCVGVRQRRSSAAGNALPRVLKQRRARAAPPPRRRARRAPRLRQRSAPGARARESRPDARCRASRTRAAPIVSSAARLPVGAACSPTRSSRC